MSVTAIIVTRGDVSLEPCMESIPEEWEKLVWCNRSGLYRWKEDISGEDASWQPMAIYRQDLAVYGRYHAIQYAQGELIYVQDDDVVVSDPQAIVDAWSEEYDRRNRSGEAPVGAHVVCNMPQEFRHDFYTDHALVGFGAAFHRDAPARAFQRMKDGGGFMDTEMANRTCDIVFTGLSPRILVDVPKENLPWAEAGDRMWKQPEHQGERAHVRQRMLQVREETS